MLPVLLIVLFLTGCATANRQATDAARAAGELEATKRLPEYPADCRRTSRSGVRSAERLDVALIRTDQALTQQNARTRRCAQWYDGVKKEFEGTETAANE